MYSDGSGGVRVSIGSDGDEGGGDEGDDDDDDGDDGGSEGEGRGCGDES